MANPPFTQVREHEKREFIRLSTSYSGRRERYGSHLRDGDHVFHAVGSQVLPLPQTGQVGQREDLRLCCRVMSKYNRTKRHHFSRPNEL